jgi:radical SAM superfamily enzyme YgiQ (UPF0313 family)
MTPDITLIFPTSPFLLDQQVFPPLGILYLSSYLKKYNYNVQCLDLALGDLPDQAKAHIIGISMTTPQRQEAYNLVKKYKEEGKILIAGGAHASHMPQECLDMGFDFVVKGEGELPLAHLLHRLKRGIGLDERVIEIGEGLNMSYIPFPDRKAIDIKSYKYEIDGIPATTLMTTRGCPYECSFCARVTQKCRMQSAHRTYKEIAYISEVFGFKAFMVFDDVFIVRKQRTKVLADLLEPHGFIFRCFARSNLIDEENCDFMKRMGVVEVGIGVESGSQQILRKNLKGTTVEGNLEAFRLLRGQAIRAKAFLIVGLPGETEDTIRDTEAWIEKAKPDDIDFTVFQPLPGSAIFRDPGKWGITFNYNGSDFWYKGTPGKYHSTVATEHLSPERIVELRDELEIKYKDRRFLK